MKISTVKGTNDYKPQEVRLRDYLQNKIIDVYTHSGFEHIMTPVIEDIENLDKSEGGENLNLIFKISIQLNFKRFGFLNNRNSFNST